MLGGGGERGSRGLKVDVFCQKLLLGLSKLAKYKPGLNNLDVRYTDGGLRIHQVHCVSGLISDTLDTQTIARSLVTVRYTGYTRVSRQVSDTLDTHQTSRLNNTTGASLYYGLSGLYYIMY